MVCQCSSWIEKKEKESSDKITNLEAEREQLRKGGGALEGEYTAAILRAEAAEAKAARYAEAIRRCHPYAGAVDMEACIFCGNWDEEDHAPNCIKAEVDNEKGTE